MSRPIEKIMVEINDTMAAKRRSRSKKLKGPNARYPQHDEMTLRRIAAGHMKCALFARDMELRKLLK
jgi:hypothetical protein